MTQKQRVGISEYKTAVSPGRLITYGLGSCLAIILYDVKTQAGGMAHTLLPHPRPDVESERKTKFVSTAIQMMLADLIAQGCRQENLVAKLFGGANMFAALQSSGKESIGQRNIRAAREALDAAGIPLVAEDTGGSFGRTVEFDLSTGEVLVRSVREENRDKLF